MHLGREIAIRTSEGKIEILKTLKECVQNLNFKLGKRNSDHRPIRGHSITTYMDQSQHKT